MQELSKRGCEKYMTDTNDSSEPYGAFDGMIEYILRQQFIDEEHILDRTKQVRIHIPNSEQIIKEISYIFRNSLELAMEGKWEEYLLKTLKKLHMEDDFDYILDKFKSEYMKGNLPNEQGLTLPNSVVFMILIKEIKNLIQDRLYDQICNEIGQRLVLCGICDALPSRAYLNSTVSTYGPKFSLVLNLEVLRYYCTILGENLDSLDDIIKEQFDDLIKEIKKDDVQQKTDNNE